MFKKILLTTVAVVLSGYLLFAFSVIGPKAEKKTDYKETKIEIIAPAGTSHFTEAEIWKVVEESEYNPEGKTLADINTFKIEQLIEENRLIKKAECHKTTGGTLKIKIYQRTPILRVITATDNYYVDDDGEVMPIPDNHTYYVPLATGHIQEEYARNELYRFAQFIHENEFWFNEIEQIYINPNLDISFVPKRGNHQVLIGKYENYQENLDKLLVFYERGLDKIGWNRYSLINLKFKDRVICTKR